MGLFDFWKNKKKETKQPEERRESVEEIVEEVAEELKEEAEECIEEEVVQEVIREVEKMEEEVAQEVLQEVTESVEEIVYETIEEIEEETKEPIETEVVGQVIEEVKEIETEIDQEIRQEKGEPEEEERKAEIKETVEERKVEIEETVEGKNAKIEETETEAEEKRKVEIEEIETESIEPEKEESVAIERPQDREPMEIQEPEEEKPQKKGFFKRLIDGLNKTRKSILSGVDSVLSGFTKIDEDLFEELEEVLIMADIGVETTTRIIERLRDRVKRERTENPSQIKAMLIDEITMILEEGSEEEFEIENPAVVLVIGVNGVGKTTTIGKLAHNFQNQNKKVLLAAADTFRAAAIDQLQIWGDRAGIDVIRHEENSDPAAVVFDAVNAAKNRKTDLLICDTAGRLHNKKNLMEELKKINKVITREYPEAKKEVFLVLDATTGQNAMQQARLFKETADITGIILTKLDGTAKGGIVIAIKSELQIPVRYIGVGEGIEDLQEFHSHNFAKALFGDESEF